MRVHEEAFLACLVLDSSITFKSTLSEECFSVPEVRRVYRAIMSLIDKRVKPDLIAIHDEDPSIDPIYLAEIGSHEASPSNWNYYEQQIIKDFQVESLKRLGRTIQSMAEDNRDPVEIIEDAEKALLLLATRNRKQKICRAGELIPGFLSKTEERFKARGVLPGLATGIDNLDTATNGFQDSRFIVIGARPSDGKSALGLNIAAHIAIRLNVPAGVISLESGNDEMMSRLFSAEGSIDGQKLQNGLIRPSDFQSLMDVGSRIHEAPLYFYDAPNIYLAELKSVARQMVAVYKVRIIFIDYLQIIQYEDSRIPRHEQVGKVSIALKGLARELKIPIVALAQLKRDSEGRASDVSDLKDAGQIEQDADTILLIHHKQKDGEEECSWILAKKNRDGPKNAVPVVFKREYVRFYGAENRE